MRRSLTLINGHGDILRHNIIKTNAERYKLMEEWRKLYGKKFGKLLIKETYNPPK